MTDKTATAREAWPMGGNFSDAVIQRAECLYAALEDHGWAAHRNCGPGDPTEPMCGKEWAERASVLDITAQLMSTDQPAPACDALWSRNQGVSCCVDTPHTVHRGSSEPDAPSWGDGECVPGTLTAGRGGR